jgi:hypothetical protein
LEPENNGQRHPSKEPTDCEPTRGNGTHPVDPTDNGQRHLSFHSKKSEFKFQQVFKTPPLKTHTYKMMHLERENIC